MIELLSIADNRFSRSWFVLLYADVCDHSIVVVFENLGMCCTRVSSEKRSCSLLIALLAWIGNSEAVILRLALSRDVSKIYTEN